MPFSVSEGRYELVECFIFGTPGELSHSYMAVSEDWPEGEPVLSTKNGLEGKTWVRDFDMARLIALELSLRLGLDDSGIPETADELRKASCRDYAVYNPELSESGL